MLVRWCTRSSKSGTTLSGRRNPFTGYFDGALKRVGKEKQCRDILFFRKQDDKGKLQNAHAVVTTVPDAAVLEAQLQARQQQVESLRKEIRRIRKALHYLKKTGQPAGKLVDGHIVDQFAEPKSNGKEYVERLRTPDN